MQYLHDIISTKRYYAFMQYALRVSGWGSSPAIVEPGYTIAQNDMQFNVISTYLLRMLYLF